MHWLIWAAFAAVMLSSAIVATVAFLCCVIGESDDEPEGW